jgi:hypothetical protein
MDRMANNAFPRRGSHEWAAVVESKAKVPTKTGRCLPQRPLAAASPAISSDLQPSHENMKAALLL